MNYKTVLVSSAVSAAFTATAMADLPIEFNVDGPGENTIQFEYTATGQLTHFDMIVDYTNGEDYTWAGDILIGIIAPDGSAIEYGGFNMTFGYEVAGDFPAEWDVVDSGEYSIYGVDLTSFYLEGAGTWTIKIADGYIQSTEANNWTGTLTIGGVSGDGEPVGACCVGKNCSVDTYKNCYGMGGDYLGDWSNCNDWPCGGAPTGACCLGVDECAADLTEASCIAFGGTYIGNDTSCDTYPCAVPPGDSCISALMITPGTTSFSTADATDSGFGEPDETQCEGTYLDWDASPDRWMVYQATGNGTITVDTCDANSYDTSLVIYEGLSCADLVQVACNGDSDVPQGCQAYVSSIENLYVYAGDYYYIRIGGWQAATGEGNVNLTFDGDGTGNIGACCVAGDCSLVSADDCAVAGGDYNGDGSDCGTVVCSTPCPGDANGDGQADVSDILVVIGAWGELGGPADVNGDGYVDVSDILQVIAYYNGC